MINKKAQELSITAIILIILGVIILVVFIFGITMGWSNFKGWILPSNNVGKISSQCRVACASDSIYKYCTKEAGLKINNKDFSGLSCEILSAGGYVEKCPKLCNLDALPGAITINLGTNIGSSKDINIGDKTHKLTNKGNNQYEIKSDPQTINLNNIGDTALVDLEEDKIPDIYLRLERKNETEVNILIIDLTGYFKDAIFDENYHEFFIGELVEIDESHLELVNCCSGTCDIGDSPLIFNQINKNENIYISESILTGLAVQDDNNVDNNPSLKERVTKLVKEASYSDEVAEDFYDMVSSWKAENRILVLEFLDKKLSEKRNAYEKGELEIEDFVKWEESTTAELIRIIQKEITYNRDDFNIQTINKERKANCFSYAQVLYFTGRAIGIDISVLKLSAEHVASIARFSDASMAMADLSRGDGALSERFEIGKNGWESPEKNKIKIRDKVFDILDKNQTIGLIYFSKGTYSYLNNEIDNAIIYFNKGIEYDKENPAMYGNRGGAKLLKSMHKEAIEDFNKALELNPEYFSAYQNRANVFLSMGDYKNAAIDYTRVINTNPDYPLAYSGRAFANLALNNYKDAIKDSSSLIAINPNFAKAYYTRGIAYAYLDEDKNALKDWKKALELDSSLSEEINILIQKFEIKS